MKKRLIISGGAVIVVAIVAVVFLAWARTPSKSTILPPAPTPVVTVSPPVNITNAYYTAQLPAGFRVQSNNENATGQILQQLVATEPLSNGKQIAITVGALPSEGLKGLPSYSLRTSHPATYTPIEFGGMPAGVPTFYSSTSSLYEITGFWPHAALYASISISGSPTEKSPINEDYAKVLSSWQWR